MNAPKAAKIRKVTWSAIRALIGIGLVVWLSRTGVIDWGAVGKFFANPPIFLAAQLSLLLALGLTAARLVVLTRPTGMQLGWVNAMQLTLIGTFFNLAFPGGGGGDVIRIWYATRGNEGRRAEVVAVMLLDRAVGLFALVLFPLLTLPLFASVRSLPVFRTLALAAAIAIAALFSLFAVVFSKRLHDSAFVRWAFTRLPMGALVERMATTVHQYRTLPGALVLAGLISLLAHALGIGSTVLLARVVLDTSFDWAVVSILPFGFLANALPLTPGGLGVGEAAFDKLFSLAGLSQGAAVLIGWRVLSLLPAALGLAVYLRGHRQFVIAARAGRD